MTAATEPQPLNDPSGGHPSPQLRRSRWCSLNGQWNFAYDDAETGPDKDWPYSGVDERTITVPFPPESELSGIGDTGYHPVVWYSRRLRSRIHISEPTRQRT